MTDLRKAAEMALEALVIAEAGLADIGDADREDGDDLEWCEARAAQALSEPRDAITALHQALAQPEQAPFGYFYEINGTYTDFSNELPPDDGYDKGTVVPVFTAPTKREWQGLTDEEIKNILDCGRGGLIDIKKVEQILKEKNK